MLRRGDRVCSRSIEDQHARPGGGVQVDIVDADSGASDDAQVPPGGENLFRDLSLTADDERVGVAHGVEQRRDVHPVDVDDPRRGGESIARGRMNGVADDDQRTGFRPVGLEHAAVRGDGIVHGILPSAGDVGGDDVEEGIEIVGGRDHRIVELVAGLPSLDEKASHAGGGIVAGVTQAVLDRMTEPGAQGDGGFQVGEDDRAFRESVRLQPSPRHLSRGLRARGDDGDVLGADKSDRAAQKLGGTGIGLQLGGGTIRAVDPVTHLIRHIQTGGVDECALRHLDAEASRGRVRQRPGVLGENPVEVDRQSQSPCLSHCTLRLCGALTK